MWTGRNAPDNPSWAELGGRENPVPGGTAEHAGSGTGFIRGSGGRGLPFLAVINVSPCHALFYTIKQRLRTRGDVLSEAPNYRKP